MSEFQENEKLEVEADGQDELSTVFSNPVEHKITAGGRGSKKRILVVIASFVATALLVTGTIGVIKLIPEREENTTATPQVEEISVLELSSDDFSTVEITNTNGIFKFYSEKTETESEDDEETTTTVNWYLEGYDKELTNESSISSIVSSAASISASREVTQKTAAECGLESPEVKVSVVTDDGAAFEILIGDQSPDNSGIYLKLSTDEKIYIVDTSVKSQFVFEAISLANTDSLSGFELTDDMTDYKDDDGALTSFDTLTVSGANFPETLVFVPNTLEEISAYSPYIVTSPTKRIAQNVENVFEIFKSGLSVSGAYSFNVADAASFGLNNPDFVATMSIKGKTLTFKFKLQEDGDYAVISDDSKLVKKVSSSTAAFLSYKATDFYSSTVCLNAIDDIKEFTFKTATESYTFSVIANPDENADDKYIVKYGDKQIKSQKFQDFYMECISLSCTDFTVDQTSSSADYAIVFTFNDDIGGENRIEFFSVSGTKHQYTYDGVPQGKVSSTSLKKLEKSVKALIK